VKLGDKNEQTADDSHFYYNNYGFKLSSSFHSLLLIEKKLENENYF